MTDMPRPVDIYIRVSRVGGRENLTSPADQEHEARGFADRRGLSIGDVLTDIDQSGGTLERPALQEALRRIERGVSGGIVAAYLSRASRDTVQGLALLDRIKAAGGEVYAPNLPDDWTTADGRMITTIQLAIDTGYRQRKREEFERAKAGAIANGIPVVTRPAVGYRLGPDRKLEPDPISAPVVREVFERRAGGAGPVELATLLEDAGITTSQGSTTWTKPAVYGLLRNRVYLGELSYGTDRRYVNAESHEAIVDLPLWMAAQRPNGRSLASVGERTDWLLTGILRCGACRYCLQGTTTSRRKRIYRCTRRHAAGECPTPVRVDADAVERAVVEAFWSITTDLEAEGGAATQHDRDVGELEEALERATVALRQWMSPDVQGAIGDLGEYAGGLRERREAREQAAEALGRARLEAARPNAEIPTVETLRTAWEQMSTRDRRELLGLRMDCVALRRDPSSVVVYPAGSGPADLPRRGFKTAPVLEPFPDPPNGARVLAL